MNDLMGDLDALLQYLLPSGGGNNGGGDSDSAASLFGFLASATSSALVTAAVRAYAALLPSPSVGPLTSAPRFQVRTA